MSRHMLMVLGLLALGTAGALVACQPPPVAAVKVVGPDGESYSTKPSNAAQTKALERIADALETIAAKDCRCGD